MRLRIRSPLVALLLSAGMLLVALIAPLGADALGRVPACRLANIYTVPRGYDDWSTTMVDWMLRVGRNYVPPDLVPVGEAGIAGSGLIRKVAIRDLRAMTRAAARNGTPIAVNSPYRSYADQVASFNGWVGVDGYDDAITYSQRPGHSEHQLGLTIDFMTLGGGSALQGDWATTPSGAWMEANAWKYGWLMSYPKDASGALFSDATCFHYEPWHYRYLGRPMARRIHDSGLTIREYMWKHYVLVDPKTGQPIATATPTPSSTPQATSSPTPSGSVAVSATATASPSPPSKESDSPPGVAPWMLIALGVVVAALAAIAFAARRSGSPA